MKKALRLTSLLLVFVALLGLTSCVPSADKVKEKMEKAGYTVIESPITTKNVDAVFVCTNLKETVTVTYYKEKADAKEAYNALKEADKEGKGGYGISGKVVYVGTEQAIKDLK